MANMQKNYRRVKLGCYASNVAMSVVGNLSPVLFITFHTLYGVSYSLLGLLVVINFVTQLSIDLIFSFFSHKFNIPRVVKSMPVIVIVGLLVYALFPLFVPTHAYVGLALGTVIFAAASGFNEVLISPVIAAIPSENPEREMSKLHSIYAWGVVGVIVFATLFLLLFKNESWWILALVFIAVPLVSAFAFWGAELPPMQTQERISGALKFFKRKELWLAVFGIFLGGAAECTMAQWASGYLEQALGIDKVWGDIFGVAMFAAFLGLGRTLYAKYGKHIEKILLLGTIGAAACYVVAATTGIAVIGLIACGFTGFCVSMLWPGSLVAATDRIPDGGVFLYAIMAAGGDSGAALVPQLVGLITDGVAANPAALTMAQSLGLTVEQLGMKAGLLTGALFPLLGIFVFAMILRNKKKASK